MRLAIPTAGLPIPRSCRPLHHGKRSLTAALLMIVQNLLSQPVGYGLPPHLVFSRHNTGPPAFAGPGGGSMQKQRAHEYLQDGDRPIGSGGQKGVSTPICADKATASARWIFPPSSFRVSGWSEFGDSRIPCQGTGVGRIGLPSPGRQELRAPRRGAAGRNRIGCRREIR